MPWPAPVTTATFPDKRTSAPLVHADGLLGAATSRPPGLLHLPCRLRLAQPDGTTIVVQVEQIGGDGEATGVARAAVPIDLDPSERAQPTFSLNRRCNVSGPRLIAFRNRTSSWSSSMSVIRAKISSNATRISERARFDPR